MIGVIGMFLMLMFFVFSAGVGYACGYCTALNEQAIAAKDAFLRFQKSFFSWKASPVMVRRARHDTVELERMVAERLARHRLSEREIDRLLTTVQMESGWNPTVCGDLDRGVSCGLWQINTRSHPYVSHACMVDWRCSTDFSVKLAREFPGSSCYYWTTYSKRYCQGRRPHTHSRTG